MCIALFGCADKDSQEHDDPANDSMSTTADSDTTDAEALYDAGGERESDAQLSDEDLILGVPETERWSVPGLSATGHVVRTEGGVPHIYGANREDVGMMLGFTLARDRFFVMDMQRRLGRGTVSALLGDLALSNDIDSRLIGMPYVADRLERHLSEDLRQYLNAVIRGINFYITQVQDGHLEPPLELSIASGLLGGTPSELMQMFDLTDMMAMTAVVMYQTTFDTSDVEFARAEATHGSLFEGDPHADLRRAGFFEDILNDITPLFSWTSSPGLGLNGNIPSRAEADGNEAQQSRSSNPASAPIQMMARLVERLNAMEYRLNRKKNEGYGSNAWAVSGDHTEDGYTLVAGDGHLSLAVPVVTYQAAMDTALFGDGDLQQIGLLIAQLPVLGVGTNGHIAWSQVNPYADTIDWYAERLQLDVDGRPVSALFQGEERPLVVTQEQYVVAHAPGLGSVGRTLTIPRYTTQDGRWLTGIEGRPATPEDLEDEQSPVVYTMEGPVIPGDEDGDGVVNAVSFDYTAFDATQFIDTADQFGRSRSAEELRVAHKGLVGSGLYTAGGDGQGNIIFSGYQATPCRTYLPKDENGRWLPGAHPKRLIDGSIYGGFTIENDEGAADENQNDDPQRCVIPFEVMPQGQNPPDGFVVVANNDPAELTTDGTFDGDPYYIGGPWTSTRAASIADALASSVASGTTSLTTMADVQALRQSRLGEVFTHHLLSAVDKASMADEGDALAMVYETHRARIDEAARRLSEWSENGYDTPSGVQTFYETPSELDKRHAVATMLFNAWLRIFLDALWVDEDVYDAWTLERAKFRVLGARRLLDGRGAGNPHGLASWNPETEESIFFDIRGTDVLESSDYILLTSLVDALDYLSAPPSDGDNKGGFGTPDMSAWLWGLRHQARFDSLLGTFLGNDPVFGRILDLFSITTRTLPLASGLSDDDPRASLKWFPRGGDMWSVDAANPGTEGDDFTHGNGPVMRMVFGLKDGEVVGRNIIPGGQSGRNDSPHFSDQLELWLANETYPVRYYPKDVAEGAMAREVFLSAPLTE